MGSGHISLGKSRLILALVTAVALLGSLSRAQAATTLSVAIAGEPWKDPSISAVGTKLTIANRPPGMPPSGGTLGFGWSTTVSGAMGVTWQVTKLGAVIASGTAPLSTAAPPKTTIWIFIPATFLAPQPPTNAVKYEVTVTPYDTNNKPLGGASAPVEITQVADSAPTPTFGGPAVYPTVKLLRYQPEIGQVAFTQLMFGIAKVKIELVNNGSKATDKALLSVMDHNGMLRQQAATVVNSIQAGKTAVLTITLSAALPPAQSQTPEEQQYREWTAQYQLRGVDLFAAFDWGGPKTSAPLGDHTEAALYKGIVDTCEDGKQDGDETPVADCGGSCDCCFGKAVEASSWRDVYGFNFPNHDPFLKLTGTYDLGDVQGVFGTCSIYLDFPPCVIPSPFAAGYLSIVRAAIDGVGRCFGFSYTALSFLHGDEDLSKYPMLPGGCDTWQLASPLLQSSPDLTRLIKRKHMYQMTNQAWQSYLEARTAASPNYWLEQLKANLPALLGLCNHAVVVTAIVDGQNAGDTNLVLYNPNIPFAADELTNKTAHDNALALSTIVLSGGKYSFKERNCEGTPSDDLTVFPYASLANPSMPSDPSSLVAFGGAVEGATIGQVTDAAGHQLFLPDGSINPATRTQIRAYPFYPFDGGKDGPPRFVVASSDTSLTHTIVPSGTYEVIFLGPNYMVHLDQATGTPNESDDLTVDPPARALELSTKASTKTLRAELTVAAADKSVRRVAAHMTLSANKKVRLEFNAGRDTVLYHHQGSATNLTLELWSSQNANATVTAKPVAVEDGDVVSISPDWSQLEQSTAMLHLVKRDGTVRDLPLR
jgi:hypothetical protein